MRSYLLHSVTTKFREFFLKGFCLNFVSCTILCKSSPHPYVPGGETARRNALPAVRDAAGTYYFGKDKTHAATFWRGPETMAKNIKVFILLILFLAGQVELVRAVTAPEPVAGSAQAGELTLVKTASPQTYNSVGEIIGYTIEMENTGTFPVYSPAVTDNDATSGPTYQSGDTNTNGILDVGEVWVYSAGYEIAQADLDNGSFTNTAEGSGSADTDGDFAGDTPVSGNDSETVNAVQDASIAVSKTLSPAGQTYDAVGDIITYEITLSNTGNVTVYSPAVTDNDVTSGPTYQSGDTNTNGILDVGEAWVYSASYEITQADLNNGSFTNTAEGSGSADTDGDSVGDTPVSGNDSETVNAVQDASIAVSKTLSPAGQTYDAVGDIITYEITLSNTGNVTVYSPAVTDNDATSGPTYQSGDTNTNGILNVGEVWVYSAGYEITQTDLNNGSFTNTAEGSGSADTDGDSVGDTPVSGNDSETVNAVQDASIAVSKTLSPAGQTYDAVGDIITYEITLSNTGNVTVYSPSVTDNDATSGPTYQSGDTNTNGILDVGEVWVYSAGYEITQTDLNNGSFTNTAEGSGSADTDGNSVGDTPVSGNDSETVTAVQDASIAVLKTLSPAGQTYDAVGDIITYEITLSNTGNVTVYSPSVTDNDATSGPTYQSGDTNTNGILDVGEVWVYSASYEITQTDLNNGSFTNTAEGSGSADTDGDSVGDTPVSGNDSETVTAVQDASIAVSKTLSPAGQTYDAVGDIITYEITLSNTGNVTVYSPAVTDNDATSGPTYQSGDTNTNGILDVGEAWVYSAGYEITQADLNNGSFTNTAEGSGSADTDGDSVGDTPVSGNDSETVNAVQDASIAVSKTLSPAGQTYDAIGDIITYEITLSNTGNVTVYSPAVTDNDATSGPAYQSGDTNTNGILDVGEAWVYSAGYEITQADLNNGSFTNIAEGSGSADTDGDSVGDTPVSGNDSETVNAVQDASLVVTKSAAPQTYSSVGEEIAYTIVVENTGNVSITDILVTDPLTGLNANIPSLVPGASDTFNENYTIILSDLEQGNVVNVVSVTGNAPDASAVQAEDTETVIALDPPTATDDANADNQAGESVIINILANDLLHDGSPALPGLVTVDLNLLEGGIQTELIAENEGTWTYNSATGEVTFTPQAGFTTDPGVITYELTENLTGRSDNANISVDYNEGNPYAIDDISTGNSPGDVAIVNIIDNDKLSDGSLALPALPLLVTLDLDPETDGLQNEFIVSGEGVWSLNFLTGNVTYTPEPGFTTDPTPITYVLREVLTGLSDNATITIEYDEVPPKANDDSMLGIEPGESGTVNILTNDLLSDGTSVQQDLVTVDIDSLTAGTQAEFIVTGEGAWTYNPATGEVTFTPEPGFTIAPEPMNYSLTENLTGLSDSATVTMGYTEKPPVTANDNSTQNVPGKIVVVDILSNDVLSDNSQVLPALVDVDLNLQEDGIQSEWIVAGEGTWTYNLATGEVTFTPEQGFTTDPGPVDYQLTESLTGLSSNATISVDYDEREPYAVDDISNDNVPGEAVVIAILSNDLLSDSSQVLPELVDVDLNLPANGIQHVWTVAGEGAWVYNPATGKVTFTPEQGFTTDPGAITYELTENLTGLKDIADISVDYNEGDPYAVNDISTGNVPGNAVTINILSNDRLSDGSLALPALSVLVTIDLNPQAGGNQNEFIAAGEGKWSFNTLNGNVTFTPEPGFTTDPAPITYILREILTGRNDDATITIEYDEVPPEANDDSMSGIEPGENGTIDILVNDRLSDGTSIQINLVTVDLDSQMAGIQDELVVSGEGTWSFNQATREVTFNPLQGFTSDPAPLNYILTEKLTGLSDNASVTMNYDEGSPVAADDSRNDVTPGEVVVIDILTNDILSDGSPALPELVELDIDLQNQGVQNELTVENEGTWNYNTNTGSLTFTPESGFISDPTPLNYRLCQGVNFSFCDEAVVTISVDQSVLLSSVALVKTALYSPENGVVAYTFEVTNTGELKIEDLTIDDERIGVDNLAVTPGALQRGETGTATAIYTVTLADSDAGVITNSASVSGFDVLNRPVSDQSGSNVGNDEPTVTMLVQTPSILIEKEAVLFTSTVSLDEVVDFTLVVTNNGNVTLNNVVVKDSLTGFEQEVEELHPGGTMNYSTSYTVQSSDEINGQFKNKATVTGTSPDGVRVESSSTVTVPVEQCDLILPTGFSPNNDGIQDFWRIKCLEKYPDAEIEIYNRWGNRVFEKQNFGNIDIHGTTDAWWDGHSTHKWSFGNEKLPTGTYYYILDLKDGNEPLTGFIFLNR
ncbi:hypothetical protein D1164_14815 [Mariniphaga sediminis]|uniref:DUF7507 domain-containing protein n=2 Tax=Mariniphaga sediminis TaxID=1628158 RepID=A0A399D1V2_9BACT|nr:hypothetical protein D1164_14815 [Mariniphaga sediminis]